MTRSRGRGRGMVLVLGMVSGLPGCTTYALWGYDYLTDEPLKSRTYLELLGREVQEQGVTASATADGTTGLLLVGAAGEPSWRLRPVGGAEVALHLLADATLAHDLAVDVVADRCLHGDEVVEAHATVRLSGPSTAEALGRVVEPSTLTEAARRVLAETRRNAFVFAADPWLYLPIVLRRCRDRFSSDDLAKWFGEASQSVSIESFVFVGLDGLPRFELGMPIPPEAQDPNLPLAARLELLGSVRLLLRLGRVGAEQIVELRTDRLWLWSACEHRGDTLLHSSSWLLEPLDGPSALMRPAADQRSFTAHVRRTDTRYGRMEVPPGRVATWLRIALTPVTAVLDCTVLLPFTCLASWLRDDDDEPSSPPGRR